MLTNDYLKRVYAEVEKRDAHEPEFLQVCLSALLSPSASSNSVFPGLTITEKSMLTAATGYSITVPSVLIKAGFASIPA